MTYITRAEFDAAVGGYDFLSKATKEFAKDFEKEFVGGKYVSLQEIDFACDEITGDIEMCFNVSYCGCCGPDYETFTVPIDYLWDENWMEREKAKRKEDQRIRDKEKAERKKKEKKEAAERRYQQYLAMKEEYKDE